jgi:transcriptional regulator with XRE-family HTH domain
MERSVESPLEPSTFGASTPRTKSRISFDIERRTALGSGLKAARNRAGFTVKEAAGRLSARGLECKRGTLLAWERGGGRSSREPFASDLQLIASIYGCHVDDFFSPLARNVSGVTEISENGDDLDVGQPQLAAAV